MKPMFEDFCEECGNILPADQLSGFGIRCVECFPNGIELEGTYYDECCTPEESVV
jgi:hypothetical protein